MKNAFLDYHFFTEYNLSMMAVCALTVYQGKLWDIQTVFTSILLDVRCGYQWIELSYIELVAVIVSVNIGLINWGITIFFVAKKW